MAVMALLLVFTSLLTAALAVNTAVHLFKNYRLAKAIGAPIRIIPISPLNPFWALVDRKVLSFIRRLPYGDNSFTRYNWRGWEIADRWRSHHEMGDIWVLVTPLRNWIYINEPDSLMSVFRRGNEFTRPVFVTGSRSKTAHPQCAFRLTRLLNSGIRCLRAKHIHRSYPNHLFDQSRAK